MATEYSLKIKKTQTGTIYESLESFGFAVCKIPWPDEEIKEPASRDWPGESGEDVYFPSTLELKPFDLTVEFCYKGKPNTALAAYDKFRKVMTGRDAEGTELQIFDPYSKRGYKKVYVKKFGSIETHRSDIDEVISLKLTFRITNPLATALF